MKDRPAKGVPPPPATYINAQNAITGLRGRDLISTLRSVSRHGLRHPLYTAKHMLALGGQLGRVLLGDTPHHPGPRDERFNDPTWSQNPFYRRGLQAYLSWQKQTRQWIDGSQLSHDDRARAHFLFSLINDALAPSNSLLNPLAVKELFNTGGLSLLRGLNHLLDDLRHNDGMPRQVNREAFEVGKTLATTPGAVVFRNELLELIQYKPMSEKQYARPLLVVPPQINKFYIFDLSPHNSFVQYMLKNGLQVFMISWRNPDPRHREWGLSSYVQALEEATNACRAISGSRDVNLMGACAGGLTMAALQGHLHAKRQLRRVHCATYLVSLLDSQFDSPASLFIDEQTLEAAKRRSYQHGVLDGREMARVFAWMRPNDLVWNYWINNYLLGKSPPAFDILYWNNDSTRLPAALHGDLLDFYKHNPLAHAAGLEVCGTPIDLQKVTLDSFTVGGENDHITPWDAVYRSTLLLGGERRFLLANSGHIQSIINPPGNPKAWFMENPKLSSDPRAWFYDAQQVDGSWWPTWLEWIQKRSGAQRETLSTLGTPNYPPWTLHPVPTCWCAEQEERMKNRDRILECALQLFNQQGEPNVSTLEIANEMGISPGNLYYHFHGKEPLVLGLFERFEEELTPLLDPPVDLRLDAEDYWLFLHLIVERMAQYRFLFQDLSNLAGRLPRLARGIRNLLNALKRTLAALLSSLKAQGQIQGDTRTLGQLVEQITLTLLFSMDYQRILARDSQVGIVVYQVMMLVAPHLEPVPRHAAEQLAMRYLED